jgi:sulfur carrier protein ThiS
MTFTVDVNLYSYLREDRFSRSDIELEVGSTITDLLHQLQLTTDDVGVVMVNAQSGTFKQVLSQGDRITLIPPIDGG